MVLAITSATLAGIGARRKLRSRQSSSRAWFSLPLAEMNWSMMPQLAPTNSFSTRWQRRASTGPRIAGADQREHGQRGDHFQRGGAGQPRTQRHVAPHAQAEAGNLVAFAGEDGDDAHRVIAPVLAGLGGQRGSVKGLLLADSSPSR